MIGGVLDDCSHFPRNGLSGFGVGQIRVVNFGTNGGVYEKAIDRCVGLEGKVGEEDHYDVGGISVYAATWLHIVSGERVQWVG